MRKDPWLTIIGMDAGGFDTLTAHAKTALKHAETIMGPERHLSMLPDLAAKLKPWPVPFSDGVAQLIALRDQTAVMLTSGDPFWFGAGSVITKQLDITEWQAIPTYSSFSLAANRLGWAIEKTQIFGLHAAPHSRLRPYLRKGAKILATMRDGDAVQELAHYLRKTDFGNTHMHILEALGSESEKYQCIPATELNDQIIHHPVMVGLDILGNGKEMSLASGLDDNWFKHDGQITKQPVRALTLSALAPKAGEHLWDLGSGSGSIAIEWLLSGPEMRATAVEQNSGRAANIRRNADTLGVDWLQIVEAASLEVIDTLPKPDAVFIGGGLRRPLLQKLWEIIPEGTRIVANGVTLETDSLLIEAQAEFGGRLMRAELSNMSAIGTLRGWKAAYPITQWVVTR